MKVMSSTTTGVELLEPAGAGFSVCRSVRLLLDPPMMLSTLLLVIFRVLVEPSVAVMVSVTDNVSVSSEESVEVVMMVMTSDSVLPVGRIEAVPESIKLLLDDDRLVLVGRRWSSTIESRRFHREQSRPK